MVELDCKPHHHGDQHQVGIKRVSVIGGDQGQKRTFPDRSDGRSDEGSPVFSPFINLHDRRLPDR
jgi:hypothetical protein